MTVDYLDPFRPVTPPDQPVERNDETRRSEQTDRVREERREDQAPTRDPEGYDDRGDKIDEYA